MSAETKKKPDVGEHFQVLGERAMRILNDDAEHLNPLQLALLGQIPFKCEFVRDNWEDEPKTSLAVLKRVFTLQAKLARLGTSLKVH